MANPNAQLQAAISNFFQPPGTTLQQAAQLQNAITQQPDLLARLNQQAATGQLTGFAMAPAGAGNRVGTYDKASGVMTLPAESFQPQGQAPSTDLTGVLRVQDMSLRFVQGSYQDANGQQQPVSQNMLTNLQVTLNESPWLADKVKLAASTVDPSDPKGRHHLEQFAPLTQRGAGATYDGYGKTMNLPLDRLGVSPAQFQSPRFIGDMTYVVGHELQHSFNHPGQAQAWKTFINDIGRIARDGNPVNDYTVPLETYLQSARRDEAGAQLSGWNATLSRVHQYELQPTYFHVLKQSVRALDFVQTANRNSASPTPQNVIPRTGITFNSDLSVSMTAANIEQLGRNYFDKPGNQGHLGHHGDSDYVNYYAAGAVGAVVQIERQYAPAGSRMQLDMQRLGISEVQLERNGIHLGKNTAPMPYCDASQPPPNLHHFDHTRKQGGYQHIPVVPGVPVPEERLPSNERGANQVGQPELDPNKDFQAYLDRMLAAADAGDDATFRRMTQVLAEQPAARAMRAEAVAAVDLQEQLAAQQLMAQQREQERIEQVQVPARRMGR